MMASEEAMEAYLEMREPTTIKMVDIVAHPEVLNEEAVVGTVLALEDQYGDWHLAIGQWRQPKKWAQGNGGFEKKLAAICKRMIHCAGRARCKGHCYKGLMVKKRQEKAQYGLSYIRSP
jgi:hypothetical protein